MATDLSGKRLGVLAVVAVALFSMLGSRLYFLQIMKERESYVQSIVVNSQRTIVMEAPRGQIIDAKGRVLAGRRDSLVVTLDWTVLRDAGEDTRLEIFTTLSAELTEAGIKTKAETLNQQYRRAVDGTLQPVVVADDVGEELWIQLSEAALPGINVERQSVRTYPYGSIAAHMLGYTGTVRDADVAAELNLESDKTYFPGDELGIAGLERTYEDVLRGVPETRRVEIDSQNRVVRTIEVVQEAVPGLDLQLSIDIDLQYAAEQILAEELASAQGRKATKGDLPFVADSGSLVALEVETGAIVALASYPSFDPRDFVFGISSSLWQELSERFDQPLLDRTIRGTYPAGSTFKPFVAYASLEAGVRDQYTTWNDEGVYVLESCIDPEDRAAGCSKQNAGAAVMGPVQLREAIERSSDTYFYSLGEQFWINQDVYGRTGIQDTAELFGFGSRTDIDLPSQQPGRVPTPENRIEQFGEDARWYPGDNVNLAIGQGDFLTTPLQLANAYAMLATGGVRYQPRLVVATIGIDGSSTRTDPIVAADVELDPASLAPIYDGLMQVVNPGIGTGRGTGVGAFTGFPLGSYPIAGKTGTAEVRNKADFALFAAFGPMPQPKYSVAAVLEQAGFGGDAAGPAVRRFFDLLAGNMPIPAAPVAEERTVDVVGLGDVDFSTALELAKPDFLPPSNGDPTAATVPPATQPPATKAPATNPPTTKSPATNATTSSAVPATTPTTVAPTTTVPQSSSTEPPTTVVTTPSSSTDPPANSSSSVAGSS